MPHPQTRRRRIAPQRIGGRLTDEQHQQLSHGIQLRGGVDSFPDEAAARAAWTRHRAELMAEPREPGRRPWGFWQFAVELRSDGHGFAWWSVGAVSEAHLVWRDHADAAERARIEAEWLKAVHAVAGSPDPVPCARVYGVPRDFAEHHLPAAIAVLGIEQRAFRERLIGKG
jgi:hypothetical protein